jgi:hypothetical protein
MSFTAVGKDADGWELSDFLIGLAFKRNANALLFNLMS